MSNDPFEVTDKQAAAMEVAEREREVELRKARAHYMDTLIMSDVADALDVNESPLEHQLCDAIRARAVVEIGTLVLFAVDALAKRYAEMNTAPVEEMPALRGPE